MHIDIVVVVVVTMLYVRINMHGIQSKTRHGRWTEPYLTANAPPPYHVWVPSSAIFHGCRHCRCRCHWWSKKYCCWCTVHLGTLQLHACRTFPTRNINKRHAGMHWQGLHCLLNTQNCIYMATIPDGVTCHGTASMSPIARSLHATFKRDAPCNCWA